jgi:hypothetical protein
VGSDLWLSGGNLVCCAGIPCVGTKLFRRNVSTNRGVSVAKLQLCVDVWRDREQ